jgi:hypothetical protein
VTALERKHPAVPQPDHLVSVLISDTHAMHREIEAPPGDLLIHAGDFTMNPIRFPEPEVTVGVW